jgi:hypothetical protein
MDHLDLTTLPGIVQVSVENQDTLHGFQFSFSFVYAFGVLAFSINLVFSRRNSLCRPKN